VQIIFALATTPLFPRLKGTNKNPEKSENDFSGYFYNINKWAFVSLIKNIVLNISTTYFFLFS
jgi:hypothetical protein